jgi:hypothetical protein
MGGNKSDLTKYVNSKVEIKGKLDSAGGAMSRKTVVSGRKPAPMVERMSPGDWAKAGSGWRIQPLQNRRAIPGGGGRIHRFLRRRSRASRSVAKQEPRGEK